MASLIKGVPVVLYLRTKTGEDAFHAPVYTETPVTVDNVLIAPADTAAVVQELQLSGKRLEYTLHIPKSDTHRWENCRVEFYGQCFRVFGGELTYMPTLTPLDWNRQVKVERYG